MNPQDTLDYSLKSVWHAIERMYNSVAQQYGLTQTTGYILIAISKEGTPATKIAPVLGMNATSLARILNTMEENGLIFRKRDETDKRMVKVFLTPLGITKRKIAKNAIVEFNKYISKNIDNKELADFKQLTGIILELTKSFNHNFITT